MKCISLWQPWASAMAVGSKRIETRSWSTAYRGPMLIHAASRLNVSEMIHWHAHWNWQGALRPCGWVFGDHKPGLRDATGRPTPEGMLETRAHIRSGFGLPFGAIIARGELVACRPTALFTQGELDVKRRPEGETGDMYDWTERQMGNYELGRFGFIFENIRPLAKPIPYRAFQKIFNVPNEALHGS